MKKVLLLLMVSMIMGCQAKEKEGKPLKAAYFFGIFDDVDDWDKRLNENAPFDKADLIYIAFVHPHDSDGDGIFELGYENAHHGEPRDDKTRIAQIVQQARAKNPNIKLIISEGWGNDTYWESARDPEVFARSVIKIIRENNVDGFDMDYEIGEDRITKEEFVVLVKALRKHIDQATIDDGRQNNPYLFTITPDHTSFKSWDGEVANEVFDYVNLQTYWGKRFKFIDQYKESGIDPKKMFIGFSSESYNRPADEPDMYIEKAKEIGAEGVFAWRLDTDSMDRLGTPHYVIAHKTWELLGRE